MKTKMELFLEEEIEFVLRDVVETEDNNIEDLIQQIKDRIIENVYFWVDNKISDSYYAIKECE